MEGSSVNLDLDIDYDDKKMIYDNEGNFLFEIHYGEPISINKIIIMLENNYSEAEIAFYFDSNKELIHKISDEIFSFHLKESQKNQEKNAILKP